MNELFNYTFHYNSHDKMWAAIPRESYSEYWNNFTSTPGVIRSNKFETLLELILRGEDFINGIQDENTDI
jgi:hypothetical protein